jgi:4-oxalocrotonate tautomerase
LKGPSEKKENRGGKRMPFIQMEAGKVSTKQKEKLIAEFTKSASEILGLDAAHFYVLIKENPTDNWGVGGKILSKTPEENVEA